jgi:hypothetical protein
MTRGLAVLGSAVFFLIAPTTVAGVVPWGFRNGVCKRRSSISSLSDGSAWF